MLRAAIRLGPLIILCVLLGARGVSAQEPDYDLPGRWTLPWDCGAAYRVTWEPQDHWEHYKATGIAYDFAVPEGTPLYAPAHGMAYFLEDERPFATNYGHYVEIVCEEPDGRGDWMIRLAHLRDAQSGERPVRAGELLGYAGSSGVSEEHLHLEILVREGVDWVAPDLGRLRRLFGLPAALFVEGAYITNGGCEAVLVLNASPRLAEPTVSLGEWTQLVIPVRNDGLEPLQIGAVQVTLRSPGGVVEVQETRGQWVLAGKEALALGVHLRAREVGEWRLEQILCQTNQGSQALRAGVSFSVTSPLALLELSPLQEARAGQMLVLEATLGNLSDREIILEALHVEGAQSEGSPWEGSSDRPVVLAAGDISTVQVQCLTLPQHTGPWEVTELAYEQGGERFVFARPTVTFTVSGPELALGQVAGYLIDGRWHLLMVIRNVGTEPIQPDRVEAWGWRADGGDTFALAEDRLAEIAPGAATLIRLEAAQDDVADLSGLVEIGYWAGGHYYRLKPLVEPLLIMRSASERQ